MSFEYEWKCWWDHVDAASIAYYVELVNAMHRSGDAFMESIGYPYWENEEKGFITPVVEIGLDFESMVRVGDVLTLTVEPDLGESSFRLEVTATHEDGEVAFTGFEQHVCVHTDTDRPGPLPDDYREALLSYE